MKLLFLCYVFGGGNLFSIKKRKRYNTKFSLFISKPAELLKEYVNVFIKGQILVGLDTNIRRNENFCENNLESEITQNQTTKKKT